VSIGRQHWLDILLKCENNDDHAYSIREYVVLDLIVSIRAIAEEKKEEEKLILIIFRLLTIFNVFN
jgi:hypothetical protein